jgi:hypothetical protein
MMACSSVSARVNALVRFEAAVLTPSWLSEAKSTSGAEHIQKDLQQRLLLLVMVTLVCHPLGQVVQLGEAAPPGLKKLRGQGAGTGAPSGVKLPVKPKPGRATAANIRKREGKFQEEIRRNRALSYARRDMQCLLCTFMMSTGRRGLPKGNINFVMGSYLRCK